MPSAFTKQVFELKSTLATPDKMTSTAAMDIGTCEMYKAVNITRGRQPWQILVFLTPTDKNFWEGRNEAWELAFKVYAGVFSFMYLLIGLMAVMLIIKKECIRLPAKTFFAVYTAIAILGFSRGIFLALDPFAIIGFIRNRFDQWIIVSRFLASFGFPSLVASYTLLFLTLLRITKTNPGTQWYQYWKFVIPVVVTPYVVALAAETIAHVASYPALLAVVICEGLFSLWGLLICVTFLFAGIRLLRELSNRERRTIRRSTSMSQRGTYARRESEQFTQQEFERHHNRIRRTTRKITIITYGTAVLGIVYSLVSVATLTMVCLFVFRDCIGFQGARANSVFWFVLQVTARISEILLAMVMLYSITDASIIVNVLKCQYCRRGIHQPAVGSCRSVNPTTCINITMTMATRNQSRLALSAVREENIDALESGTVLESRHSEPDTNEEQMIMVEKLNEAVQSHDQETDSDSGTGSGHMDSTIPVSPMTFTLSAQCDCATLSAQCDCATSFSDSGSITCRDMTENLGLQTVQQVDKAVQTDSKPTPKPCEPLEAKPEKLSSSVSPFRRKQTV